MQIVPVIQNARRKFSILSDQHKLHDELVRVTVGALSPEQAIGNVARDDYALHAGREVMIEADFKGHFGQAFTDSPANFSGYLCDLLNLNLDSARNRAIFVAALNAVCSYLGVAEGLRHCRDREPEDCGERIARDLLNRYGRISVGQVGYQPAILENLVKTFGVSNIWCTDLDPRNIGANKYGLVIRDGNNDNRELIGKCDLVLITGSSIVNNTFDEIRAGAGSLRKDLIMFGVTAAGVAALLGIERICPFGH